MLLIGCVAVVSFSLLGLIIHPGCIDWLYRDKLESANNILYQRAAIQRPIFLKNT